jgi:hypothetical protein
MHTPCLQLQGTHRPLRPRLGSLVKSTKNREQSLLCWSPSVEAGKGQAVMPCITTSGLGYLGALSQQLFLALLYMAGGGMPVIVGGGCQEAPARFGRPELVCLPHPHPLPMPELKNLTSYQKQSKAWRRGRVDGGGKGSLAGASKKIPGQVALGQ